MRYDFGVGDPTSLATKAPLSLNRPSPFDSKGGSYCFGPGGRDHHNNRLKAVHIHATPCERRPRGCRLNSRSGVSPIHDRRKGKTGRMCLSPVIGEAILFPDLSSIPLSTALRLKLLWINYPTTRPRRSHPRIKEVVAFCMDNDVLFVSDEAYSALLRGETCNSPLRKGSRPSISGLQLAFEEKQHNLLQDWVRSREKRSIGPLQKDPDTGSLGDRQFYPGRGHLGALQ